MRTIDAEDMDVDGTREVAEEVDRALTRFPAGLAEFHPRIAFGSDPSQLGWPPTLPIELALRTGSIKEICASYGIEREEWDRVRSNPAFQAECSRAAEAMRKEGASFKFRAQLQATEYLKEAWRMVHDRSVPAAVRAQLILKTVEFAGLNEAKKANAQGATAGVAFQINLNLG